MEIHAASRKTKILPVDSARLGVFTARPAVHDILDELEIKLDHDSGDAQNLQYAAKCLREADVPVAFPTETVYGLGADATRSSAVRGIYKAKQRPSDNPLIVHFASLGQLRALLLGHASTQIRGPQDLDTDIDCIPQIYKPLITRFWPGPLTLILPNPKNSPLAPEVTAGLATFGARIPRHPLALALIHLADVPVAAPSANASTKPSPTAAEHVAYDLGGRIETIVDGGPCDVGVESTVVDGLTDPPLILRPGGISLEQIRSCPGWENTQIGYQNLAETGSQPRAPGMKYRHYSPKATVILFEAGQEAPSSDNIVEQAKAHHCIGIVRTRSWTPHDHDFLPMTRTRRQQRFANGISNDVPSQGGFAGMLKSLCTSDKAKPALTSHTVLAGGKEVVLLDLDLGPNITDIARGVFSALRDLDREGAELILIEGIADDEGDTAAAVMNRLRKAAEIRIAD